MKLQSKLTEEEYQIIKEKIRLGDEELEWELVRNNETDEKVLHLLFDSEEEDIKRNLVLHPNVSDETLEELSLDASVLVKKTFFMLPKIPDAALYYLSQDYDQMVYYKATKLVLQRDEYQLNTNQDNNTQNNPTI